ncbi:KN motif and ankyrin repeat domain-containing protein 2 isoform X2 [Aethina tumida]|uniref:KN motif and ankyrin repeat domain-containing protein 2 isoform X2 n=1 Tax=Aethina tumida TaxID=116153 RepID=UPI002148CF4D|nr:KN motif and ankyrin repeat domain-containing protein 2 isoform X2 [Aethina tumida]
MSVYPPQSITKANEHGYSWYECNCCPYGYHIDLDFVRYCESFSQNEADKTGSIQRRKDRRRQRQSMEVLLGITPTPLTNIESSYKPIQEQASPKIVDQTSKTLYAFNLDGFNDAVTDFERTLQRSKNKNKHNLPDVTAVSENIRRVPSNSSMSSVSGSSMTVLQTTNEHEKQDFDTVSIESYGLSPLALQNIREQMALSLERTKHLEDQVKLIPELKEHILLLKEENQKLKLKAEENQRLSNNVKVNYFSNYNLNNRTRSHSFTTVDNIDSVERKEPPPPPPRKDFGVMCGVLTRNIGVGHQNPNTKSVATTTLNGTDFSDIENANADKWLHEKVKFLNLQNAPRSPEKITISKGTQTIVSKEKRDAGTQAVEPKPRLYNNYSQTVEAPKFTSNVAVMVSPEAQDFNQQKNVDSYTVGCSDDTISDVLCPKCSVKKVSLAVGPESNEDSHTGPMTISLANLTMPRSKSFNMGEDKLNLTTRKRTVACQYESSSMNRGCQATPVSASKSCQHETRLETKTKQTQYERAIPSNKTTDTKDLTRTREVGCTAEITVIKDSEEDKEKTCTKCLNKEKEESQKKDRSSSPTPSRIPRPQVPTTPVEVRKFRRQDTYTKIYNSPTEKSGSSTKLSGLDLSPKSVSSETSPLDKVKQNFKFPEVNTPAQNGSSTSITKVQIQETTLPISESTSFHSISNIRNRKKAEPSKEMQGAMKVLNDSLMKNPSKSVKNPSAINIVQQEWFKISSLVTANPLDVEDYLDAFEDMSSILLEYVVNMTDASGNTAMHYAVSHGNFDVVSILLDSKVCDINKPNNTGYTSVMLVSLAKVKSETHANVVRRLFQLADVNIRAKQHGQTALMLAVSHGRLDMVTMLLEAGADINIQDEDGSTALMCAAEHGHIEIVKHFLSHPDCDSSITDVDGSTALKIAMEAGHRHIGVLLYAHERNHQKNHGIKLKKTKSASPKTPSSPLPIRSSHRALTDTKTTQK